MKITEIKIEEFDYPLPDERIAKYPLERRDLSKLLFLKKDKLSEHRFTELPDLLPGNSLLLFNETKVIQARLLFRKATGALIEIFCLEPVEPFSDFQIALRQHAPVTWKCMVGNARRWKSGKLQTEISVNGKHFILSAEKKESRGDAFLITFSWKPSEITFSDILETAGLTPLPPYLHREAENSDKERYQTIYAHFEGSVAAPTAGLHFTEEVMTRLRERGVETDKIILHVGAGTFKPVSSETVGGHEMHTEKIRVSLKTLEHLRKSSGKTIIPVGTTSLRSLESLFWMALRLEKGMEPFNSVEQWDPYYISVPGNFDRNRALDLLKDYLEKTESSWLEGETRMIIVPGYQFRFAGGLITNFHQPKSTLLLLVSALIGRKWKEAYRFALERDFRFLSYGDSCLFLP